MTPQDFCYWLKGAFEINGDLNVFTANQAAIVKRHLAMTFQAQFDTSAVNVSDKSRSFCSWLAGVLDAADTSDGISASLVTKIRAKLAEVSAPTVAASPSPRRRRSDEGGLEAMC